jgi:hypothetical protein
VTFLLVSLMWECLGRLLRKSMRHNAHMGHLIFNHNLVAIQTSNWTPFQLTLDGLTFKKSRGRSK